MTQLFSSIATIFKVSILVFFIFFIKLSYCTGPFHIILTKTDISKWAVDQHNEICRRIYPAVASGQLTPIGDTKPVKKSHALTLLEYTEISFISTDPDDPTIGRDTVYQVPLLQNFHQFIFTDTRVQIQASKNKGLVTFDKKAFMQLLTDENMIYLDHYAKNGRLFFDSISNISNYILHHTNVLVYQESIKPSTSLFINDSLKRLCREKEKQSRSKIEIVAFINTDPEDVTIGRDTVYQASPNLSDTGAFHRIIFAADLQNMKIELKAISCDVYTMAEHNQLWNLEPMGFLEYNSVFVKGLPYTSLLENCLEFTIIKKAGMFP